MVRERKSCYKYYSFILVPYKNTEIREQMIITVSGRDPVAEEPILELIDL